MPSDGAHSQPPGLEDFVEAFENARSENRNADIADFLPDSDHPAYLSVLVELVRVDLELSWCDGQRRRTEDYLARFPILRQTRSAIQIIAREEYRLRQQTGDAPSPREYSQRLGVDVGPASALLADGVSSPFAVAEARHALCQASARALDPLGSVPGKATGCLAGAEGMPEVGDEFLGFHLMAELGRGAFARVFLARQHDLADRLVALKISAEPPGEVQMLARLQHPSIVPIYSSHRMGPLGAVCMPYLGPTTLMHVLRAFAHPGSVPTTGSEFVRILQSLHREAAPAARQNGGSTAVAAPEVPAETPPALRGALKLLDRLSYVDAVAWMAARLADGLAHAHDHGIVHRDLKPANVLVNEDGQPMLLDFNLSHESNSTEVAAVSALAGGTLPYMAPEHLQAFSGRSRRVDQRSDLYSLGIILFEMLSGAAAFPSRAGLLDEIVPRMLRDREGPIPSVRRWNANVTPAAEAVVHRCLQWDPEKRYQTAHQLRDDLERQLEEPSRHAASLSQRLLAWPRRGARSAAWAAAAGLLAVLSVALASLLPPVPTPSVQAQAVAKLEAFSQEAQQKQAALEHPSVDPGEQDETIRDCRLLLSHYHVLEDPRWQERPALRGLTAPKRVKAREEVGGILFLYARVLFRRALSLRDAAQQKEQWTTALRLNESARACYESSRVPRALWQQRADLLTRLARNAEAQCCRDKADQTPLRTARDYWMAARPLIGRGDSRAALPLLEQATALDPQSYWAWMSKGHCHEQLGDPARAEGCYSACVSLAPAYYKGWFCRGTIHVNRRHFQEGRADLDRAVALNGQFVPALLNRAVANTELGSYDEAVADLARARRLGAASPEIEFKLADARRRAGDKVGAARDLAAGLRFRPNDERGWIMRGLARMDEDPRGGLADFDEALKLNPRSLSALSSKGDLFYDRLRDYQAAAAVFGRALQIYPNHAPARAARGLALAHLGRREPALEDARTALLVDRQPSNVYLAACIYAQTSRSHPANSKEALALLAECLNAGFKLDEVEKSSELEPVRGSPEYKRIISAARSAAAIQARAATAATK